MAKIRAKRSKVGAPKKKAPVKKAAPKKAAKAIKTELKNKGLKLPHGYGVEKRARVGSSNNDVLNGFKIAASWLAVYNKSLQRVSMALVNSKKNKLSALDIKELRKSKKMYQDLVKETKTHMRELKKLL